MKKILILGSGGAGKSTLARHLSEISEIEVIHLDQLYWQPNWGETPKNIWIEILEEQLAKDAWIMDGNFDGTLAMRLKKCDTVLFLDVPRLVCLWRVVKRFSVYKGRTRPDMGEGCREKIDYKFLKWIWDFPRKDKSVVEDLLKNYDGTAKIIRLKSKRDVENFFVNLQANKVKSM